MTALALELAQSPAEIAFENPAIFRRPQGVYIPQPVGAEVDCNRFLRLQIAVLAPLSAALWAGIAYGGYHLFSLLLG